MLHTFLEPKFQRNPYSLVQQDEATAHTARTPMWVLSEMFPACVISWRGNIEWPARLPDLNACNFCLWGYLQSKVYERKPRTIVDWTSGIKWQKFLPPCSSEWCRTSRNALQECVDNKRCHLTDTVFRKWILQLKCFEIKLILVINSHKRIVYFPFYFNLKIVRFFCWTCTYLQLRNCLLRCDAM
jgi:hypothetical protein